MYCILLCRNIHCVTVYACDLIKLFIHAAIKRTVTASTIERWLSWTRLSSVSSPGLLYIFPDVVF